jgi:hypothetical protein
MHAMSQVAQLHMAQSSSATKNASESKVGDKAKTSGAKSSKKQRDDKGDKKDKKPSWPRLKFVRKNITKDKIPLLVSKKQDKRKDARERILSYGAGTCPVLLDSLHDKTSPELAEELRSLLDELDDQAARAAARRVVQFSQPHAFALDHPAPRLVRAARDGRVLPQGRQARGRGHPRERLVRTGATRRSRRDAVPPRDGRQALGRAQPRDPRGAAVLQGQGTRPRSSPPAS